MKRSLACGSALAVLLAVLSAVLFGKLFIVREICVEGGAGLDREAVISASGIEQNGSIFRLNREAIDMGISAIGTHALSEVEICWPDTVVLRLRKRVPAAMIECVGGMAVIDADCIVIGRTEDVPGGELVYLSGASAGETAPGATMQMDAERLAACRAALQAIRDSGAAGMISELNLGDAGELYIISRGGTCAALGDDSCMEVKLAWMCAVLRDMEMRGESGGSLDLSKPERCVLLTA